MSLNLTWLTLWSSRTHSSFFSQTRIVYSFWTKISLGTWHTRRPHFSSFSFSSINAWISKFSRRALDTLWTSRSRWSWFSILSSGTISSNLSLGTLYSIETIISLREHDKHAANKVVCLYKNVLFTSEPKRVSMTSPNEALIQRFSANIWWCKRHVFNSKLRGKCWIISDKIRDPVNPLQFSFIQMYMHIWMKNAKK